MLIFEQAPWPKANSDRSGLNKQWTGSVTHCSTVQQMVDIFRSFKLSKQQCDFQMDSTCLVNHWCLHVRWKLLSSQTIRVSSCTSRPSPSWNYACNAVNRVLWTRCLLIIGMVTTDRWLTDVISGCWPWHLYSRMKVIVLKPYDGRLPKSGRTRQSRWAVSKHGA